MPLRKPASLTQEYRDDESRYTIHYDPRWEVLSSPKGNGVLFYLSAEGVSDSHFSVSVIGSEASGGVSTIAYFAALERKILQPLNSSRLATIENVCALREGTRVYIQRDDVLYTISAAGGVASFGAILPLQEDLRQTWEAIVASFDFIEPWSSRAMSAVIRANECWR